jgi:glutaredoxin-dependent peroxiredoxin
MIHFVSRPCRAIFTENLFMSVQTGQQAPDFTLFDSDKNEVKLSDLKGSNVLLLFFPLAFTSTCTAELCSIRDNYKIYENLDAKVLGISVDSLFTLDKFRKEQNLNFPLLSDFNKDASNAYDSLYEDFAFGMKGVSKRSAFLIDKEGTVRYAQVLDNAGELPDFNAIQTTLEQLN